MIVQLTTSEKKEIKDHEITAEMTHNFQHFVEDKYGHIVWHRLNRNAKFRKIVTESIHVYGDIIFQIVADWVSTEINKPIGTLLHEFSTYLDENTHN